MTVGGSQGVGHPLPQGRAFVYGDNIDTDALAPGTYMKSPLATLASHCLETVDKDFARTVRPGDFVVGGRNFGMGSSREQAAEVLRHLEVSAVIAPSFGGIFQRNALNLGLPVLVCPRAGEIRSGDLLEADAGTGRVNNLTSGFILDAAPLPLFLLRMIADGGLVPHLEARFGRR